MNEEMITPEMLRASRDMVNLLMYLGGVICTALVSCIVILWKAKEKEVEYIKAKEKEDIVLYSEMAKSYERINETLIKLNDTTNESIRPLLVEIKDVCSRIMNNLDNSK